MTFIDLKKIVTYINENIEQKITLKEIASREHISPYYLSHFFLKVKWVYLSKNI